MHEIAFIFHGMLRRVYRRKIGKHMLRRTDTQVGRLTNVKEQKTRVWYPRKQTRTEQEIDQSSM